MKFHIFQGFIVIYSLLFTCFPIVPIHAYAIYEVRQSTLGETTIRLNDMEDIEMLYCGHYMKLTEDYDYERCFIILYKDNRPASDIKGKYGLYTFKFGIDWETWDFIATPVIERMFPLGFQDRIRPEGEFFVSPNNLEFFFFTSGTNDSELWGYIFRGEGGTDPVKLYDFAGRKINSIASSASGTGGSTSGMDLTVGLETGEVYMFTINNSNFSGGNVTPKWQSIGRYGKIKDLRHKGWAQQAM